MDAQDAILRSIRTPPALTIVGGNFPYVFVASQAAARAQSAGRSGLTSGC